MTSMVSGLGIDRSTGVLCLGFCMDLNLGADTAGLYAKTTMEAAKCERDSSKDSGESDCE